MTSNCDVTISAHQIQMTTLCHWMKPPHENFLRMPLASLPDATCRSRQWCHINTIELPNYVVTMKPFHWGRDIGCFLSLPHHCSCMSDQLLMWHNAEYSVYYTQRQVSASLWNLRVYSRSSTYIKSVYKHYTVTDMKVTDLT